MLLKLHKAPSGNTTLFSVLPRWEPPAAFYATFLRALDENGSACLYFGKYWRLQTHRGTVRLYRTGTANGVAVEVRSASGKARLRKQLLFAAAAKKLVVTRRASVAAGPRGV